MVFQASARVCESSSILQSLVADIVGPLAYKNAANHQQRAITGLNLFYAQARKDVEKSGKTDQLFADLGKQGRDIDALVRPCITGKTLLDNQVLPGEDHKSFDLFYWGGSRDTDFLKQFDSDRSGHLTLLAERSGRLAVYETRLVALMGALPDGQDKRDLQKIVQDVSAERAHIDNFRKAESEFFVHRTHGEKLAKRLEQQKGITQTFEKQRNEADIGFKKQLADCNQDRYMQYASVLRHKNTEICIMVQGRNEVNRKIADYEKTFVALHFEKELEAILGKPWENASAVERTNALVTLAEKTDFQTISSTQAQILTEYRKLRDQKTQDNQKIGACKLNCVIACT